MIRKNMIQMENLLCYLYLDNKTFVNSHLVRAGFGGCGTNPVIYSCKKKFLSTRPKTSRMGAWIVKIIGLNVLIVSKRNTGGLAVRKDIKNNWFETNRVERKNSWVDYELYSFQPVSKDNKMAYI